MKAPAQFSRRHAVWYTVAVFLAGCGTNGGNRAAPARREVVKIDGSSTVFPMTEAVAEEFQKEKRNQVSVTVGISGTGGGFKKFCRGETDVTDASRPILQEEMQAAKENGIEYIELPVCFDALTIVVHPDNDWVDSITVAELKKIWEPGAQETVTRWNQVRPEWPEEELALFGPGPDSGTFDYFTEAVVGKAKASRGDYTASEDDNVLVQGVSGNKFALGYLGFAYYSTNAGKIKALAVDAEKGDGLVSPSLESVLSGKYHPLSRPLFIYVNPKSAERTAVKEFVEFYLQNAKTLATEVKYLPLDDTAYETALTRFQERRTGTGFGGTPEIGLSVEDILKREPKSL